MTSMKRNQSPMRRAAVRLLVAALPITAVAATMPARAADACWNYQYGHVYYVAYQNNPAGAEYVVDLGDRSVFENATDTVQFPDVSAGDFSSIFPASTPNVWVGIFGLKNPTRDGILSDNGPSTDFENEQSSQIGAAQQIDSWASGIAQFANEVGAPCHANAATFPGKVYGSYQNTLNTFGQGHLAGQVRWNVEERLSTSGGVFADTGKTHFNACEGNPSLGTSDWGYLGYFEIYANGTVQYWPDRDGDFLPDVPPGSDPEADLCPGVNSTDNTDGDGDQHAAPCDCNEADASVWAIPGEVANFAISSDKQTLTWSAQDGGTTVLYDVIRGQQATVGGVPAYSCFASNQAATSASDPTTPAPGALPFLYLVRAHTSCGIGTAGDGLGVTRTVPASCP
jgi:hypothetical protein